jgi:hypothetical protein
MDRSSYYLQKGKISSRFAANDFQGDRSDDHFFYEFECSLQIISQEPTGTDHWNHQFPAVLNPIGTKRKNNVPRRVITISLARTPNPPERHIVKTQRINGHHQDYQAN